MKNKQKMIKKAPFKLIFVSILVIGVIGFAFYWESLNKNKPDEYIENAPPVRRSVIQDEINSLSWIEPEFLPINRFSRPGYLLTEINGIVIHFIGNPNTTAIQNRNFFANLANTEERHASSNFIVCLDGTIVQCVPVDEIAYASNHRNDDTISIELCHPDETGTFTDETYNSAVRLTAWLSVRFGLTKEDIIRHYDVSGKICPLYFVLNEEAWDTFRADVAEEMLNIE